MSKPVRFTPKKTALGTWRLNVPAKYSETGNRQRFFYSTKAEALAASAKMKDAKEVFGTQAIGIAPSLAEQAIAASKLLEPLSLGLLEAVARFVEAEMRLRASVPIEDAIAAFRASGTTWSNSQATAYRLRGEKLIEAFQGRMISEIGGEEIRKNLEETTGGAGAFNQNVRLVRTIWRWCAKPPRQWCEAGAVEHLEAKPTESGEIGTLTPAQAAALMSAAESHLPDTVPAFAIALFTGMRQAEIERLRPQDITEDGITLRAVSAKTKRRRFIQMPEPLAAWLAAYPIGETVTPPNWPRKEKAVRRLAGFAVWSDHVPTLKLKPTKLDKYEATPPDGLPAWPENALRHTAATVALALGKPLEQLVFEHGHAGGLEMLRKHYIGAMPKKDAAEIWRIAPHGKKLPALSVA
jgi:integrase